MKDRNIIRLYFEPKAMSIIDRARFLTEKQSQISVHLNKFTWVLFDKTVVDLREGDQVIEFLKKRIKKRIRSFTTIKDISDDYSDETNTVDGYYASKKYDDDTSFTYTIGAEKSKYASSLIIINFDSLDGLTQFDNLKSFIIALIDFFKPLSVEVSEYKFYREKMDLKSDEYWFGWMTYFSNNIIIPEVPSGIIIEELPNGGKLIITTEEFFMSDNPDHFNKAKSLVDLFRKKNIRN